MKTHCTFLQAGELSAIVGDDVERGPGGQQYSGVWSLTHRAHPASPFQAAYAGLLAGAHRGSGPALLPVDQASARLTVVPADPSVVSRVVGTYQLREPYYIDYTYQVTFADDARGIPPCVEHSWCCYMNSPADSSIHFIQDGVWSAHTPLIHGQGAMVFPAGLDDAHRADWERRTGEERFAQQKGFDQSFSGQTFDYPFYFGIIHGMVFLLMADTHRDFRFFISPSGAGPSAAPGRTSPAWDFAWRIWHAQPGETRTLQVRLAYFSPTRYQVCDHVWREWELFREQHPLVS